MQNYSVYTRLMFHKKHYNFHFLHKSFDRVIFIA